MTKIGRVLDKLAIGEFLVVVKMRSDPLFSLSLRDEKELTTVPNQLTTVLSLPTSSHTEEKKKIANASHTKNSSFVAPM